MNVYSPFELVVVGDVEAGDLVQFDIDDVQVKALVVLFDNGELTFLVLEGDKAGCTLYPPGNMVQRFVERVTVELPRRSRSWNGYNEPARKFGRP